MNSITGSLELISNISVKLHGFDKSTLYIRVYSDGLFASNADLSSQLGYVLTFCDATGQRIFIDY